MQTLNELYELLLGSQFEAGHPLRWHMTEDALGRLEKEKGFPAAYSGDQVKTLFGVPIAVGQPSGGRDIELISATDLPNN